MTLPLDPHRERRLQRIRAEIITVLSTQGPVSVMRLRGYLGEYQNRDLRRVVRDLMGEGRLQLVARKPRNSRSGVYRLVA